MSTLATKGVKLFKLTREDTRPTPRRHRFAVIPRGNPTTPCNPLIVGRWYVHVYQTKIEINGVLKTLNSKAIARDLQKKWGLQYYPRTHDTDQVLPHPIPLHGAPIQNIPYPPAPQQNTAPVNSSEYPLRDNSRQINIPTTSKMRQPHIATGATTGVKAPTHPTYPTTIYPSQFKYINPTYPHLIQSPYMWQNLQQHQQLSPQQWVQPQPLTAPQSAQLAHPSVPGYHQPQMNLQPNVQNPYFTSYNPKQQYNVNGRQTPWVAGNGT